MDACSIGGTGEARSNRDGTIESRQIQRSQTKEDYNMNEAEKNAETVRRGYEAFNAADMKTLTELFDENAVWHSPGRGPLAGDHQGREAVFCPIRPVCG